MIFKYENAEITLFTNHSQTHIYRNHLLFFSFTICCQKECRSPEFYNDINSSLSWVLCRQDIQTILRAYLRAIGNKDAVLLYELNAEQSRDGQARNAYVLRWNHVLEDWCIFDFQILTCIENNKKEEDVTFFLTTYCEGKEQQVISVIYNFAARHHLIIPTPENR